MDHDMDHMGAKSADSPIKDLMCYKCHNWSNPSHSNCLEPDNETPLVNCTEMYAGYELGQIVCESSE